MIFDLDNTLALIDERECPLKTMKLIEKLKKEFTVLIITNNTRKRIIPYQMTLGVDAIYLAMKPFTRGLRKVQKKYGFQKSEMIMIGDQLVTDIKSGVKFGIKTILVDPLGKKYLKRIKKLVNIKKKTYSKEVDIMNKKCLGCGVELQDENMLLDGYTVNLENDLCQRCFRLKNYGEYQATTKTNEEYQQILEAVGKTKDLVVYVTDVLNVEQDLYDIRKFLPNKILLVLNKRDVIPKSVKDEKLIQYFKDKYDFFNDIVVVSCEKNMNIDHLLNRIKFFQVTKQVYVVGHTNAGKSSLINKLIKNYSDSKQELTISPLPSTTLNLINIEINDYLTIIDTPGLIDEGSITNYVDNELLKIITPKKEIKTKTYQLRRGQSIIIGDLVRIDYVDGEKNSFTLYISNDIKTKRIISSRHDDLKNLAKRTYQLPFNQDIVIKGLGFIKVVNRGVVDIYLNQRVETFLRDNLI